MWLTVEDRDGGRGVPRSSLVNCRGRRMQRSIRRGHEIVISKRSAGRLEAEHKNARVCHAPTVAQYSRLNADQALGPTQR